MELQSITSVGAGRRPGPKPIQDGRTEPVRSEPSSTRPVGAQRLPDGREQELGADDRLVAAHERLHNRLAEAVDATTLSPRQQQALESVMGELDQKLARLSEAGFEGGDAKADLHAGLDQIYGAFLDQLQDILGAGQSTGPDLAGGLAIDTHA